ncbi:hypothetical protein PSGK_21130 [Pseudomonas solani]|uniref:hypothetical protein n=1 Tax=Pseudomonas solani TaxID=2731552 RepID=UPI0035BE70A1
MSTAAQRLAEVRKSISDILNYGQSVQKDGRKLERAELGSLRMLETQYVEQAAREAAAAQPRSKQIRLSHRGKGVF